MSDQEFVIELEPGADWLEEKLRRDGSTRVRILPGEDGDTEGHGVGGLLLNVVVSDDDDTEGHAIAIHFPSRQEADAFRKRLLITGVLVGTVALGAAGGIGLSALQSDDGAGAAGGAAITQTGTGPMDVNEALALQGGTDAGPMDINEARALQAGASTVDADRDVGVMDASGAAAGTNTGPMDINEARALQAGASTVDADRDLGIMDSSGAAAGDSTNDDAGDPLNIGGPTPR